MIRRDKNRAATIIWSIANETTPGDARNKFLVRWPITSQPGPDPPLERCL
jgi:beta-galactosidase/beta-glucuronidase